MPSTEDDLEKLRKLLDAHVREISEKLKRSTSEFAKQKIGELETTIIKAKENAAIKYQKSLTEAEGYRGTSDYLADTAIDFARKQYKELLGSCDRRLRSFIASVQRDL